MHLARNFKYENHFFFCFRLFHTDFLIFGLELSHVICLCVVSSLLLRSSSFNTSFNGWRLDLPYFLQDYFFQGYGNFEIMAFPVIVHNIFRGIRTLKRWLKGLVLKRASRRYESRLEDIVTAILDEMERWV